MTTIVKARSAADFLSLVPHLLGFHPHDSLVLVPFDGSRSLGVMRFDLPAADSDVESIAATVIGLACRVSSADAVAIVVYTPETLKAASIPQRAFVDALRSRADACGLRLTDALCVGGDAWGSYLEPATPARLRPLTDLDDEPAGLAPPDDDVATGAELPPASEAERAAVADALASLTAALAKTCGVDARPAGPERGIPADQRIDPRAFDGASGLDDLPGLFEDALGWDAASPRPFDAAVLAWCLSRPALRDVALLQWGWGLAVGDEALEAQLRWEEGEPYSLPLASKMWGEGDRPDIGRLERALELLRVVASRSPIEYRAGALTAAAWISWALGRSTHADLYASRACDADPEYRFAELIRALVAAGHLPDWAFRRA